jgi:hypothetical protein
VPTAAGGSDPVVRDFANVPNTGAQYSEHESVVQGPPVNGQPTTKFVTEVTESDPAAAPVDTKTTSFTKTTGAKPALVAADPAGNGAGPPPNTANNVPGAGKPGKAAKPMYDTNHPKEPKVVPVTTNNNVPNAPSGGAPGPPGPPPPAMVESDLNNMPFAPGGGAPPPPGPAGAAPGGAAGPAPNTMATPAPASKVGGLWWEPHLPTQTRPNTPA